MSNIGKTVLITAVTSVVFLGLAAAIFFFPGKRETGPAGTGFRHSLDETKTVLPAGIDTVSINTSGTDVYITAESREDVAARLYGTVRSSSKGNLPELTVEENGDTIVITVKRKGTVSFGFYSSDLRLDVVLPRSFGGNLFVRTSSGDLDIASLSLEDFEFNTSSGYGRIENLSASSVRLRSSAGDVEAGEITSSKIFRDTSSGKTVIRVFSGDLNFTSSSGGLIAGFRDFDNNVIVDSSSGDIELILPPDAGFTFDVRTSSGDIETEFPFTLQGKVDKHNLKGSTGTGSGSIRIKTSSGDVRLKR